MLRQNPPELFLTINLSDKASIQVTKQQPEKFYHELNPHGPD